MIDGRTGVILGVLALGLLAPFACSPQVVDAVDALPASGGSTMTGGTAGSGVTGGSAGTGASEGGGPSCPDGSEADQDGDGTLDCNDECPLDPNKTVPGQCGCGLPNPNEVDGGPSCNDLTALLAHRYTFIGPAGSEEVVDSQAGAEGNGDVVRASLSGQGTLVLAGGRNDQYAGLPNGLLTANPSITLEAWVRWNGGNAWQRIFDFGDNDAPMGEGYQGGSGTSYLFLTPRTPVDPVAPPLLQTGKLRLAFKRAPGELELIAEAPIAFPSGGEAPTHVAVVVDSENKKMTIYINGVPQNGYAFVTGLVDPPVEPIIVNREGPYDWGTPLDSLDGGTPPPVELGAILDHNNWLGRSQFVADDGFAGTYYEFRIYSGALTAEQIAISHTAGPDPVFFPDPVPTGQ
jgi:hypothetical protein